MFNRHLIIQNNNSEYLYLYIDNFYEFSKEFDKNVSDRKTLSELIEKYINDHNVKFNGLKVFLVASGIVISYVILSNPVNEWKSNNIPLVEYMNSINKIHILNEKKDDTEIIKELVNQKISSDLPIKEIKK